MGDFFRTTKYSDGTGEQLEVLGATLTKDGSCTTTVTVSAAMTRLETIWKKRHHQVCYHLPIVQGLHNFHHVERVGAVDSASYDGDAQTHTSLASKNDE